MITCRAQVVEPHCRSGFCVHCIGNSALEVDGVEAVEHRLQRLRRVELLQLVHLDDLLQLRPQALLHVGVVAAAAGLRTLRK